MATQSVQNDKSGPDFPLGLIANATPGTPIQITSLIDPNGVNDPSSPTPGTAGADEYTLRAHTIRFTAAKSTTHGTTSNTGNVYLMRKGVQGAGNRDDYGAMVAVIAKDTSFELPHVEVNRNMYNPYRYWIDADNAGDGVIATMFIG